MLTGDDPRRHRPALLLADVSEALSPAAVEAAARAAGEELVRAVRVGDYRRMHGLVLAMGADSAPAAPALIAALRQADPEEAARRHAEPEEVAMFGMALGRIGAASPEVVPALSQILREHQNVDVRGAALTGLAQLDPEDVKAAAAVLAHTIIEDPSPALRRFALEIFSRVDEAAAQQALERAGQGPRPDGQIHERDGQWFYEGRSLESWIEHLSVSFVPNEIFGRPRPETPLQAITAPGDHAVPALIEALESTRWPIRRAAARAT
jgi:HEAT repeat protein